MNHLVVDPSLVLKRESLDHFKYMAEDLEDFQIYFPGSFLDLIQDAGLEDHFEDRMDEASDLLYEKNIYRFYRVSPETAARPDEIREAVSAYRGTGEYVDQNGTAVEGIDKILSSLQGSDTVDRILVEEASFLFSGSGLISRIKKPLNRIRDGGANMIEYSKKNKGETILKSYMTIKILWGGSPIYIAKNITSELFDLDHALLDDHVDTNQIETAIELLSTLTEHPAFAIIDP